MAGLSSRMKGNPNAVEWWEGQPGHIRVPANAGQVSHATGMIGEGRFVAWASSQGWHLYRGMDGHTPCDYIADTGSGLIRVEVKCIEAVQKAAYNFYYCTCTKIDRNKFDFLFISTPSGDYWIPASEVPVTLSIKQRGEVYEGSRSAPGKYEKYLVSLEG